MQKILRYTAIKKPNCIIIKRGIFSPVSGTIDNIIVEKNGKIRFKADNKKK